jgi:hypothetical protein
MNLLVKSVLLLCYYTALLKLGIGIIQFKYWSFQIVSASMKYFNFNHLSTSEDRKMFAFAFLHDLLTSSFFFGFILPMSEWKYVLVPLLIYAVLLPLEFLEFNLMSTVNPLF